MGEHKQKQETFQKLLKHVCSCEKVKTLPECRFVFVFLVAAEMLWEKAKVAVFPGEVYAMHYELAIATSRIKSINA